MVKSLQELAALVGGTLENEDKNIEVTGVNGIMEAGPGDISFAVPPYVDECHKSRAGVMILGIGTRKLEDRPVIRVANPRAAFAILLEVFRPQSHVERSISQYAYVDPRAKIGRNVAIQPFCYIEREAQIGDGVVIYPHVYIGAGVKIGRDSILYPNSVIRADCVLGERVILQPGAVIGSDGFGYTNQEDGTHIKVPQSGNVIIEDDVEIGANSTIDRATVGSTVVGRGTKIDNLVHLGHNVTVGKNCFLCGQVGVAGSTGIGDNNTFAGQVAVNGHITIGNNNLFAGRTGITKNVGDNQMMGGFPERSVKEWMRHEAELNQVGKMRTRIRELEKQVAKLQEQLK